MQTFYSPDYHTPNHLTPVNSTSLIPAASGNSPPNNAISNNSAGCLTKFNDIDALNSSYPTYNNWSNGYNNYQYAAAAAAAAPTAASMQTPAQAQYAAAAPQVPHHGAPAMLIYPQVYSTVNQNQIHLHLHGTDKIEQYLNANENGLSLSSGARNPTTDISLNGSAAENLNVIMENDDGDAAQQQQQQQHQHHRSEHETSNHRDEDVGDPGSVWRPY